MGELLLSFSAAGDGSWNGGRNGGQMGKSTLNEEKREKKRKTAKTPRKTGSTENPEGSGNGNGGVKAEAPHKGANKSLRHAVKKVMKARSTQIAESLVSRTVEGDMRGAGMLMSLVERKEKEDRDAKKTRTGPSAAELLASEPEWDEEMAAKQATGTERREPEKSSF